MKFMAVTDFYFLSVMVLTKLLSWFSSIRLRAFVARTIGLAAYWFLGHKRRLSERNLSKTFEGSLRESQIRRIIIKSYYELWYDTFSLSPSASEKAAIKQMDLRGLRHLQKALEDGKGVILWESSYFGRRALAKQILHEHGYAIHQVHAANHLLGGFMPGRSSATWIRDHVFKPFLEKGEKQFVSEIIYLPESDSLTFTRVLLNQLKQNDIVCMPGGGMYARKFIPTKFLGQPISFSTGIISLTKISGAPLLPMFCIQENNDKIGLIIESPISMESNADREHSIENGVNQYVSLLESYIRKYPEQYRSWHFFRLP
jgi:lauroyl/myristoyl acyltransferase